MFVPHIPGLRLPFGWIILGVLSLTLALGFSAKLLRVRTVGHPVAPAIRAGDHIAILYSTVEPYIPSLHHRPESERVRIDLRLIPIRPDAKARTVSIGRELPRELSSHGVGFIGVDGDMLWFTARELFGYDLRKARLIRETDIRKLNPELDDFFDVAQFEMDGHLRGFSRDNQQVFDFDPVTLRASRATRKPKPGWSDPSPKPETFLCGGVRVSAGEWLGASSDDDLKSDFKPGFSLSKDRPIENANSRALRRLHLTRLRQEGTRTEIESTARIGDTEYQAAAFVRNSAYGPALRLAGAEGYLMTSRTKPLFEGTHLLMRLDAKGQVQWSADTGIAELDEFLPDPQSPAFIGRRPRIPDKLQDQILVVVDATNGSIVTHSLKVLEW